MAEHNELGTLGEQIAAHHLEEQGYTIVERNARLHHWECDIIALKDGLLVFVEVKTRSSEKVERAEQAVDIPKAKRMVVLANKYIRSHHRREGARFDIIAVVRDGDNYTIRHTPHAFTPMSLGRGTSQWRRYGK